ncbi:MAG: hypothetical protein JWN57_2702 [Frankiales bacterium]|nr:hypothetical protein [Frankiales bacterium]
MAGRQLGITDLGARLCEDSAVAGQTAAAHTAPPEVRPWTVSLQLHVWTSTTVRPGDLHEAMELAEDEAQLRYGDGIFIDRASTEVA